MSHYLYVGKAMPYKNYDVELLPKRKAPRGMVVEANRPKKQARNEMCTCGSGKKYKKCCIQ